MEARRGAARVVSGRATSSTCVSRRGAACRCFALRQACASGPASRPSASNWRHAAARCSSPARSSPRSASASSRRSCARRSKGGELQPRRQAGQRVVAGRRQRGGQVLQHGGVQRAQAAALADQPGAVGRAAGDLQPLQELAREARSQRAKRSSIQRRQAGLRGAVEFEHVHRYIGEVEPDRVAFGQHTPSVGAIEQAAQLAQAAAKLGPRIAGQVPEQLAQRVARQRPGCERQVGEQGTQLARGRQGDRLPAALQRQRPEHADFHASFHACIHGGCHARRASCGPAPRTARAHRLALNGALS